MLSEMMSTQLTRILTAVRIDGIMSPTSTPPYVRTFSLFCSHRHFDSQGARQDFFSIGQSFARLLDTVVDWL